MTAKLSGKSFWSERFWPIVRVLLLQLLLMLGIIGNLVGWLVMALLVDQLHWLNIDFHGKTTSTISPDGKVLAFIILFTVNLLLVVGAWRLLERKPLSALLWNFSRDQWRPLGLGLLAGFSEVVVVFGVMSLFGVVHSTWGLAAVSGKTVVMALGWVLGSSILGPILEEVLNRGYWFQNIQRGWGVVAATLVTCVLFGGLHLLNPNAEILGAVNISLSALTFVLGMVWLRSLWFPIGWHAAWNFFEFFLAGLPNSGISVSNMGLRGTTLLESTVSGPVWLSGGEFGMEASLINTIVLVCAIAIMFWVKQRQSPPAKNRD